MEQIKFGDIFKDDFESLREEFSRLSDTSVLNQSIKSEIDLFKDLSLRIIKNVEELRDASIEQPDSLQLIFLRLTSLTSFANFIHDDIISLGAPSANILRIFAPILSIVTRILKKFTAIIFSMVTPKEWKVSGKLSTGVPFLFNGDVALEVTFGK